MGFFDKSLYLRTFFIILPLGIVITYASFKAISGTQGVNGLNYIKGSVKNIEEKDLVETGSNQLQSMLIIELNESNIVFFRSLEYLPDTLKNYISIADTIEIWSNEGGRFWQLKSNGQMLLKYKSGSILWFYGLFVFGIGTIVIAVLHLIKGRSDLFGGRRQEDNKGKGKPQKWTWF